MIVQRRIALNNTDAKRLPRFVILFPSKKREQEQSQVREHQFLPHVGARANAFGVGVNLSPQKDSLF